MKTFKRNKKDYILAGILSSLSDTIQIDVTILRILVVGLTLMTGPIIPFIYVLSWILTPDN